MTNRLNSSSYRISVAKAVAGLAAILLAAAGCSISDAPESLGSDKPGAKYEDFEEFSFSAPEGSDHACDGDCSPRTTTMCDITRNADVLALVRVLDVTEHRDSCEERPYRYDYREVGIDVIDVAAGDRAFADATSYKKFLSSGFVEAGRVYRMTLYHIDNEWWGKGVAELIPGAGSAETSPAKPTSEAPGRRIYDLPTNRTDFVAEADRIWSNYEEECGREQWSITRPEIENFILGTASSCSEPSTPTSSGEVNNIHGPIPGDDTYDAGD